MTETAGLFFFLKDEKQINFFPGRTSKHSQEKMNERSSSNLNRQNCDMKSLLCSIIQLENTIFNQQASNQGVVL